jgi:hypothetical protein
LKLSAALTALAGALHEDGARFALVGGLAASARGEPRFTRDVDVAVAVSGDEEAEALIFSLNAHGYRVMATVEQESTGRLATARLKDPSGVTCDLIFATSGIEPEVVASAEQLEIFPGRAFPTASVEGLLAMKVLAATPARPRDLGDIASMLAANAHIQVPLVLELLGLIESRGYARGQALVAKWHELVGSLS